MPKTCTADEQRQKRAAYMREYNRKNREKILAQARARHKADPTKKAATDKRFRMAHGEYVRKRKQQYAQEHREEIAEKSHARYMMKHEERRQKHQSYYQTHREEYKEKQRQYLAAHPEIAQENTSRRRARKASAPLNDLTPAQWREMQMHYDHRCVYCGKRHKGKLTQDHITPLSKGGAHTKSNIVPACRSCNSKKHTGPPLKPVQPLLLTLSPARAG